MCEVRASSIAAALLFLFELVEQRLELVRDGFIHHLAEHRAQPVSQPVRDRVRRSGRFSRLCLWPHLFFTAAHGVDAFHPLTGTSPAGRETSGFNSS